MQKTSSLPFREDINGLRAWAALAVLLFHFKLLHFSGGFAGVDVFFVISGYLMTAILYPQLIADHASSWWHYLYRIFSFYLKRLKRVAPVLLALLAILWALGPYLMLYVDYQDLAREIKYASVFWYNNKYYEVGYFDRGADEHWLMHTWTLGLEFQFYILFPILLLLLSRISRQWQILVVMLLSMGVISFVAMCWQVVRQPSVAFFLLPFRMWEFLAGSVAFFLSHNMRRATAHHAWILPV